MAFLGLFNLKMFPYTERVVHSFLIVCLLILVILLRIPESAIFKYFFHCFVDIIKCFSNSFLQCQNEKH